MKCGIFWASLKESMVVVLHVGTIKMVVKPYLLAINFRVGKNQDNDT